MNIQTAAQYMRNGYRVRRAIWRGMWISQDDLLDEYKQLENLLADDWEIITEGVIEGFPVTYEDEL